ncbi:type III effector protein [Dickeya lacustris]|uniref:Type III effector protein n=1 Tax=Dickeya lacustris TaxID=2259638 RepID=A0ABY8G7L2_9GAMM|nr:type III effector protein [Dickeya lacustris]WFN55951.1 type III effector protein [Dickeya lacustris]
MADINITLSIPGAGMGGGLGGAGGVGGADSLGNALGGNGPGGKKSTAQENQLLEALAVVLTALLPTLLNGAAGQGNSGAGGGLGGAGGVGAGAGNGLGADTGGGLGGASGLGGGLDSGLGGGLGNSASGSQGQNGLTDILTKLLDMLIPKNGASGAQGAGGAGGGDALSGAQGAGGAGGAGGTQGLEDLSKSLLQDSGANGLSNGISPTQDGGGQISDNPLLKILLALVALLMENQKNQFGQPQGDAAGGSGAPVSGAPAASAAGSAPASTGTTAPATGGSAPKTGGVSGSNTDNNTLGFGKNTASPGGDALSGQSPSPLASGAALPTF